MVSYVGSWTLLIMDVNSVSPSSSATLVMMLDGVMFWMMNLAVGVSTLWWHPNNFLMLMLKSLLILLTPWRVM